MRAVIYGLLFLMNVAGAAAADLPTRPDHAKAPGVSRTTDPKAICGLRNTKDIRHVTDAQAKAVWARDGIAYKSVYAEVDHLISLENGGANDEANLWIQSYWTPDMNAHTKDQLENRMHKMGCAGLVTFEEIQHDLRTDWIEAFVSGRYFTPAEQAKILATVAAQVEREKKKLAGRYTQ